MANFSLKSEWYFAHLQYLSHNRCLVNIEDPAKFESLKKSIQNQQNFVTKGPVNYSIDLQLHSLLPSQLDVGRAAEVALFQKPISRSLMFIRTFTVTSSVQLSNTPEIEMTGKNRGSRIDASIGLIFVWAHHLQIANFSTTFNH